MLTGEFPQGLRGVSPTINCKAGEACSRSQPLSQGVTEGYQSTVIMQRQSFQYNELARLPHGVLWHLLRTQENKSDGTGTLIGRWSTRTEELTPMSFPFPECCDVPQVFANITLNTGASTSISAEAVRWSPELPNPSSQTECRPWGVLPQGCISDHSRFNFGTALPSPLPGHSQCVFPVSPYRDCHPGHFVCTCLIATE